jgi:hypothetical protein
MIDSVGPLAKVEKPLKERNRWQLWIVVATNFVFFYGVVQTNAIEIHGLRGIIADAGNLLAVGVAVMITTLLNAVLSADVKARLFFLRWRPARLRRIEVCCFALFYGGLGFHFLASTRIAVSYLGLLVLQYLIVR